MKKKEAPVSGPIELPSGEEITYDLDGRRYIVTSVFKDNDTTSCGSFMPRSSPIIDSFNIDYKL